MNDLIQFIQNPDNAYLKHTLDYTYLCLYAILLAIAISIPLGILVARRPVASFLAINITGLMRAVPPIAFLAAVIPVPFLGVGFVPALIALVVLGIPPILLNTATGINGIDPATIDAARGMGMTGWQIIRRIQIPLVLPIIAAGIRTSAVQIIATATLAAITGAGGYGEYIYLGLRQFDTTQLLAGVLPVSLLALLIEILMSGLQRALTPAGLRVQAAGGVVQA